MEPNRSYIFIIDRSVDSLSIGIPLFENDVINWTTANCADLNSGVSTNPGKFSVGWQKVELLHEPDEKEEVFFLCQRLSKTKSLPNQEGDQPFVREVRVRLGVVEPIRIKLIRIRPIFRIVVDVKNAGQD